MTGPREEAFLEVAAFLGRRLCRDALWAGERCNWLGDSIELIDGEFRVAHRVLGPDLYGGTSGIALFLARLYRLTGEPLFRSTAEGALAHSHAASLPPAQRIGFYTGLTGIAYATAAAGEAFGDQALIEKACTMAVESTLDVGAHTVLDVLAGVAGAIPALIDLQRWGRHDFVAMAVRLGDHLLDAARKGDAGWSWSTLPGQAHRDMTGFSHGAAGIAWALLELSAATREARFLDAARQGFAYERQCFDRDRENWPDFRGTTAAPPGNTGLNYMVAWCHGAPGIGLSRVRAWELTGEDVFRREAEAAMRTTVRMLSQPHLQTDFTACHGRAGNAELLICAGQVFDDPASRTIAESVGRYGIEAYRRKDLPWPCGVLGGGETPNLMLGLAGIGYFYLRLYAPGDIAPVLILRPGDAATI
jgi:lantibiotic biosynthesis protein